MYVLSSERAIFATWLFRIYTHARTRMHTRTHSHTHTRTHIADLFKKKKLFCKQQE